jgi:hypothetical protein
MIKLSSFIQVFQLQNKNIDFMKVVTSQLNTGLLPRTWQSGTHVFCGTGPLAIFLRVPSVVADSCATIFQFCQIVIGHARQIIGSEQTIDAASLNHLINAILAAWGVIIGWIKQGMDALELWVDRGDGKGFVFLDIDSIPDNTDTAAMPPAGQSALWKYKGIYIPADQRVGQWSENMKVKS